MKFEALLALECLPGEKESVEAFRHRGHVEKSECPDNQSDFCPHFRTHPRQRGQPALRILIGQAHVAVVSSTVRCRGAQKEMPLKRSFKKCVIEVTSIYKNT